MNMHRLIALIVFVIASTLSLSALAQQKKCEGPADMCAQIQELQKDLAAQKALSDQEAGAKTAAVKAAEEHHKAQSAKLMAIAAVIAVGLKILMSLLKTWVGFFKTDQGKAAIKAILVVAGFAAFVLTNIGMGIPWWQALIIAGGPPGAIVVHELMDLVPVIFGKKKLPPDPPAPPPDQPPAPDAPAAA